MSVVIELRNSSGPKLCGKSSFLVDSSMRLFPEFRVDPGPIPMASTVVISELLTDSECNEPDELMVFPQSTIVGSEGLTASPQSSTPSTEYPRIGGLLERSSPQEFSTRAMHSPISSSQASTMALLFSLGLTGAGNVSKVPATVSDEELWVGMTRALRASTCVLVRDYLRNWENWCAWRQLVHWSGPTLSRCVHCDQRMLWCQARRTPYFREVSVRRHVAVDGPTESQADSISVKLSVSFTPPWSRARFLDDA